MDHLGLKLHGNLEYIPYLHETQYGPKDGFHAFPGKAGWKINERHGCQPIGNRQEKFLPFLQAWLFFGLLHTVLSDSIRDLDVYQEFTTGAGYLTTESLPKHLTNWKQYEENQWEGSENNHETKKAYSIRMVRIQMALDRAKGVVRRYCSLDGTPPTGDDYAVPQTHEKDTFDLVSLSLIVLGETLSNAKAKIVEQIGFKIRGWHGDAAEGWGTSRLVRDKMKVEWCAKTLHVLEGQFCGNTTGLLAAFSLQPFLNQDHKTCTTELCKLSHVEDENTYEVRHQGDCDQRNCGAVGIEPKQLQAIIRKGAIPLLLLQDGGVSTPTAIKLTDTSKCKDYATISHVWSDGYGNPKENKMHRCQLEFLRSALHSVDKGRNKSKEVAFWIDTLAIPVGEDYNDERRIAIGRIHETFVRSRYTIVIDKELCQKRAGDKYHEIAMRILASGWMRRLWTLQEAYLSDKIFFKFRDDKALDLEELEAMFPSANDTLNSSIPSIARSYFHSLLGTARRARIHDMTPKEGLSLIASVWKATQWRTTTHKQHEVLALATLFDLNTGRSEDANSLNQAFVAGKKDAAYLDAKMCTLLELLEKVYPGSIPAGIIFLPGQRLTKKGFGWAPRTWISGQGVDYPDPLAIETPITKFVRDEGLYVQLPGFLLHSSPGTSPVAQMEQETLLRFPVDSTLSEWYEVKYADEENQQKLSRPFADDSADLKSYAIILPRQRPRDIKEIALMVRIGHPQVQRSFHHKKETQIYNACIVFRIWVQKITSVSEADMKRYYEKPKRAVDDGSGEKSVGEQVFGEVLDHDQMWCVDQELDSSTPTPGSILESSEPVPMRPKKKNLEALHGLPGTGGETGQTTLRRSLGRVSTFFL